MKKIKVEKVRNYLGGMLKVPVFDDMGEMITKPVVNPNTGIPVLDSTGQPVTMPITKEGTLADLLGVVVAEFPRGMLKMKHIVECNRLHEKVLECQKGNLPELELEEASYDWLIAVLKDNQIGVPIFGMNLISVLKALGAEVKE